MSEANGRTSNGRFAAGNPGGPGRPRREIERAYLDATIAAVSVERWSNVVAKALNDAEAGDGMARSWLSKVLGMDAPQRLEHNAGDDDKPREIVFRVIRDDEWYGLPRGVRQTADTPPA